jgi:hypothetical protein
MNRKDNKIEMRIISEMNTDLCSGEIKFLKRIYTEKQPEKTIEVQKIMDGLIMVVMERTRLENRKKRDSEDNELLAFANGEINAMCYCLGLDTRL